MPNVSNFPDSVDTFITHLSPSASDNDKVERWKQLVVKVRTVDEDIEFASLTSNLRDKILTAEDINFIQNSIVNIENFFLNEIQTYLTSVLSQTDVGNISLAIGSLTNLLTVDKSSIVNSINEIGGYYHISTLDYDTITKVYRQTEYRRRDTAKTLFMRSTASNQDSSKRYQTVKWEFFKADGTVAFPLTWTLTYDSTTGNIIKLEVA